MEEEIVDLGFAKIKFPKVKEVEEKKITLIGQCPFCERKVRGITRNQLWWNLSLHVKQRHGESPDAKILLKQFEEKGKIKTEKK